MMGDLNTKVGSKTSPSENMMRKHGLGDRAENGESFASFYSFQHLIIGGTRFRTQNPLSTQLDFN